MIRPTLFALTAAAVLAGCMPVPAPAPVPAPLSVPAVQPIPVAPVSGVAGLEEREPDLCGAKTYVTYLGQSATLIPTMGITKTYRVVEYRGIEPQEYDPQRIVFRLDAAGNIYNIDCG